METIFKIMREQFIHKKKCRICDSENLIEILDLGEMPPANSFLKKEDLNKPERKFPLVVYFCKNCGLLQLLDVVNQELLFGYYDYLTSASKPLAEHFIGMGNELVKNFIGTKDDLMVEIGGNDAVLLSAVKDKCRVLNIEPAKNVAELSKKKGVETINEFFSKKLAEEIVKKYGNAKVVVANNVIAHIDDLKSVFEGVKTLIGEDGTFVFEIHWVGNLISEGGFDQIYHEHLCYHSLTALNYLVNQMGLKIFDVELIPIHGQSMRVFVGKNFKSSERVREFLKKEKELGLDKMETFLEFAEKVESNKNKLKDLLLELKKDGKRIVGYGAPAKGNTLLNYFEITLNLVDYVIDTTPLKQGLYTPGAEIPIYHPDKLKEEKPDYILLLAWNYADAILEKEKELRNSGIKFIIPVPDIKIV
ncbi:MAG: class I SAM-dependent methyltransferase [Patescibacteria group bacterium]